MTYLRASIWHRESRSEIVEEMKRLGLEVSPDVVGQIAIFAKTSFEPTLL